MDRRAVETLVRVHQAELFRYLRYLGARPDAAVEDLVQETFLVALRGGGPRATDERQQAAWLRGIARHLFLAHCRKERAARTHLTPDALRLAEEVWADEFLGDGKHHGGCESERAERMRSFRRQYENPMSEPQARSPNF